MQVITDNEIDRAKWEAFLVSGNFATPFQAPSFYDLFNSIEGYSASVFATEENGLLTSLVVVTLQGGKGIKGFFSRRAIIYGGPVLANNREDDINELLSEINRVFRRRSIYTEIRSLNDYSLYKNKFYSYGWNYIPYLNFMVSCKNYDDLYNKLSASRKRQIKKALKTGIEIAEPESLNDVYAFYNILRNLYQKKVKKPLLPLEFFNGFYERKIGKYLLVKFNGNIIGGIMCPVLEKRAIYEMYICGLDEEYKEQYPGIMATWAAMEYASGHGIPVFDFMGAGRRDENYGVRDFKARFGGEMVEYGRFLKINKPLLYNIGKAVLKFLTLIRK
jgi:serine/alanine adding enzyme